MISIMEISRIIDVTSLDTAHRRAIEDVIGVQLQANQRVLIGVDYIPDPPAEDLRDAAPTLEDWQSLYDGLTDDQIEVIDRIANTLR